MALELQTRVLELVHSVVGGRLDPETPTWLNRPGRSECGRRWPLIQQIYHELTDLELPETMPPRERRQLDGILVKRGQRNRILEVDETQHFNRFRAVTLAAYPRSVRLGFPKADWIKRSQSKQRLEGGGFGKPRPPLFPGEGGRHRQRAFRDALADILPPSNGFGPTIRIAYFEVEDWIYGPRSKVKMRELLENRQ